MQVSYTSYTAFLLTQGINSGLLLLSTTRVCGPGIPETSLLPTPSVPILLVSNSNNPIHLVNHLSMRLMNCR